MTGVKLLVDPVFGARFPRSLCLLVESNSTRVLIDSGCGSALQGLRIDAVIYTHHHPDHISGYTLLAGEPKVYSPCGEEAYDNLEVLARRLAGYRYRAWLRFAKNVIGVKTVPKPNTCFKQGEDVCIRDLCFKTYPARGHTTTHTLIELPGRWLHLADIDLTGFGPWYGNPESDPQLFLSDIAAAAKIDARAYTTGHRADVLNRDKVIGELAKYAGRLFDQAEAVLKAVASAGEPVDEKGLVRRGLIYRRYIEGAEDLMEFFEETMIRKLLSMLYGLGCIVRTSRGFTAESATCSQLVRLREKIVDEIESFK